MENKKTLEEMINENIKLEAENIEFTKIEKDINKKIRGKYWLWFFLPLFGLIIYVSLVSKRKTTPEFSEALIKVKTEIAKNQFKIMLNNRDIERLKDK